MFTEYLKEEHWRDVMPGIQICTFSHQHEREKNVSVPVQLRPCMAEILFCSTGTITFRRKSGIVESLGEQEIFLLSDCGDIASAEIDALTEGVCLSADQTIVAQSFQQLCRLYGNLSFSTKQVAAFMRECEGFHIVRSLSWNGSMFHTLKTIPALEQGHYCVMKCFELLYLLCVRDFQSVEKLARRDFSGYMVSMVFNMKEYMEEHLDEKMTIKDLSHCFQTSPTACKNCFRACFGQPIHSWLLGRRMERAAELLTYTKTPILQVAQEVGYTSISQFNIVFKRRYGLPPGKYRKMSLSKL